MKEMTEKLYDQDSHLFVFRARVLACEETKNGLALELDRTDSKGYSTFTELCFLQAAVLGKKLGVAFPDEMLRKGLTWLEEHIYSPDWKWVQIVPFKRISPMVYQFAGMFWDEQQLLDKAKRECADEPWKKMIVFRSVRYKTVQG